MSAVQLKEVVEALLDADTPKSVALAKYVEQHGIAPLDGMMFVPSIRKLSDAPCDVCGYNGPGYYQPDTHPCAAAPEVKP